MQNATKNNRTLLFPVLFFAALNLAIFTLSRIGLSLWQSERVSAVDGWLPLFLQGLRIDIVALSYLFGSAALLTILFAQTALDKIWMNILRIWLTLSSVFILFMEMATPAFIETYDFRPNRLFIEYLICKHFLSVLFF